MAQTRYGDLRDTFHLSRLTNKGLLRHADFFSILLEGFIHMQPWARRARHERERKTHWRCFIRSPRAIKMAPGRVKQGMVVPTGFEPVFKP
jgi:hypothetical protein